MKRLTVTLAAILAAATLFAQSDRERIIEASKDIHSIECDFTQSKQVSLLESSVDSQGKLYYSDGKLRWQYDTPYRYEFILNGDRAMVRNEKSTNVIDTRSNRRFRALSRIIAGTVDGSSIENNDDFDTQTERRNGLIVVTMIPRTRSIGEMFERIELFFSAADCSVSRIEMTETGGDRTVITLKNKRLNGTIDNRIFDVD